jgi:hypothetical protein
VATANKVSGGGGAAWGAITGTLSAQTDLQTALDAKVNGTGGGSIATGGFTLTVPATGTAALRGTANTFTAAQTISVAGANSTPPLYLTGALNVAGNGTTTFPHIFHQPVGATAATNWRSGANDGTVFGANEVTGFVGNFLDLKIAGTSRFIVHHNGDIYLNNGTTASMHRRIDVDMLLLHQATGGAALIGIGAPGYNPGINISRDLQLSWTSDTPASARDLILVRKAAATLQLGLDAAAVTNQMFTAASRITSDGVGANLTIAPGNGRGGAGGSLILATYDTQGTGTIGNLQTRLTINTAGLSTFSGSVIVAAAGANSTPPLYVTGALNVAGNGTTTFPHIFHQPTGATAATTWSNGANAGTVFGANEVTGFVGNFLDFRLAGATRAFFTADGKMSLSAQAVPAYGTEGQNSHGLGSASGGCALYSNGFSILQVLSFSTGVTVSDSLPFGWRSGDVLLYRKAAATLQLGTDAAGVTNQTFTAASRITSDGVGANLTIAPGNGRGAAGGSLILATFDTQGAATIGNLQTRLTIDTTGLSTFSGNVNVTAGTRTGAALTLSQTWNNAGVTCRGLEVAVTNTNSAADSTIFRILGGAAGTSQLFNIDKNGWVNGPTGTTMVIAPAGGQNMNLYATGGGNITCNAVLDAQAGLSLADSRNITFATTNGTIIGTATNQKMGFWNATPVVRPAHIADPAGGAVVDAEARTAINAILAWQATLGLTAAA